METRTVPVEPKQVDPFYLTPEYQAWRAKVIARAGARCQAIDAGLRCTKTSPAHRLFADHIVERRDGGAPLDPANGQCLCGQHHTLKTMAARAHRMATPVDDRGGGG
jgi:5-methylcytosine-specific restriction protein A